MASGGGRLVAFVAVHAEGYVLAPCGRCRQLLLEHGGKQLLVKGVGGIKTLDDIFPDSFGPDDLH